jgi:hypothetical protein
MHTVTRVHQVADVAGHLAAGAMRSDESMKLLEHVRKVSRASADPPAPIA